ncbi:hypothetical protein Poly30_16340 [Planctomycetes bacterium Poly30]|uniref:DUF1499 domain-containing protein n=1 Tax=Saltatorellus ferox TaxID=2528018 RepID=A0A518EPW5_9BACT|nr:hypothetical protein Poly30_16340 [Planctomycetes bacterium Poly30]
MKLKPILTVTTLALALLAISLIGCAGPVTAYNGTRLGDCPSSPNCVCSEMAPEKGAHVDPFTIPEGTAPASAFEALAGLVSEKASIETREPGYFHAVYKTRWLRFRDDFEARLDAEAGVIHVRSASRLGYSDLGMNARRVKNLRQRFAEALK